MPFTVWPFDGTEGNKITRSISISLTQDHARTPGTGSNKLTCSCGGHNCFLQVQGFNPRHKDSTDVNALLGKDNVLCPCPLETLEACALRFYLRYLSHYALSSSSLLSRLAHLWLDWNYGIFLSVFSICCCHVHQLAQVWALGFTCTHVTAFFVFIRAHVHRVSAKWWTSAGMWHGKTVVIHMW